MSLKFREKLNPTPGDWKLEGEKKNKTAASAAGGSRMFDI